MTYRPKMTIEIADDHPWYQWLAEYAGGDPARARPYIEFELGGIKQRYRLKDIEGPRFVREDDDLPLGDPLRSRTFPKEIWLVDVVLDQAGDPE